MLRHNYSVAIVLCVLVCVAALSNLGPEKAEADGGLFHGLWISQQQNAPEPFLYPPFYETAGLDSVFDHEYPSWTLSN
jgi:hypothetical protein